MTPWQVSRWDCTVEFDQETGTLHIDESDGASVEIPLTYTQLRELRVSISHAMSVRPGS